MKSECTKVLLLDELHILSTLTVQNKRQNLNSFGNFMNLMDFSFFGVIRRKGCNSYCYVLFSDSQSFVILGSYMYLYSVRPVTDFAVSNTN